MPLAYATYEILTPTSALVEVIYSNGNFGIQRVVVKRGDLYETCYKVAEFKATIQGDRLETFHVSPR